MADYNTTRNFDLAIPATVTTGTPVDCSTAGIKTKSLILPAGAGFVYLYVAGKSGGNYVNVGRYKLDTVPRTYELAAPDFAYARLDRASESGALTAQLVGEPVPGGAQGDTGATGATGAAGATGATGADGKQRPGATLAGTITTGKRHSFDVLDANFTVGGGTLVAGEDGITADGTNKSTITITALDAAGVSLGTIGTFTLDAAKTDGQRVAMSVGAYTSLLAGSTLAYEKATTGGTGATIGEGAYFELTN